MRAGFLQAAMLYKEEFAMENRKVLNEVINGAEDTENLMVEVNELTDGEMENVAGGRTSMIADSSSSYQGSSVYFPDPEEPSISFKSISFISLG